MIQEHKTGEKREQVLKACVRSFREKAEDIKLALVQNEDVKESLGVCLTIIQDQQVQIDCLTELINEQSQIPQLKQELEQTL